MSHRPGEVPRETTTLYHSMLKTLYNQIGKYKTASLLCPVFIMLEVVLDVLIPYVTSWIIDRGITPGDLQAVYRYGALMLLMALLSLAMGILAGQFSAKASTGFAANVRSAMYRNVQRFAFSDIDKYSTAGLVTRMTTDVTNLQNAYQMLLRITVRAPFTLLSSIVMCFVISPRMSLVFVVATAILATFMYFVIKRVGKLFAQVFKRYDEVNNVVRENVTGVREVKAFVREEHEKAKFGTAARALHDLYVRAEALMATTHPVMNMVVYGCIIAISWWGAHFVVAGELTTGQLTSLFAYVMSILMSLMMLSMIFVQLTQSAASGERVAQVINEVPDIVNPEGGITDINSGRIDFNRVSFAYKGGSGEYALAAIDVHIRSGETIGVIGGTGSGKSTLMNLVSRLYDATRGTVAVDGKDVRTLDLTALRDAVAVVLQHNVLFSGTVLDNLRWGNEHATPQQCREACDVACATEFIDEMPDGFDTVIEQGGTNVSGGQRQRLCIARALLKQPRILILDDSTSALDNDTDRRVRQRLSSLLPDVTKVIISQRITSIRECDRILVLDGGRVVGFDKHDVLLQHCEVYREICELQDEPTGDFDNPDL